MAIAKLCLRGSAMLFDALSTFHSITTPAIAKDCLKGVQKQTRKYTPGFSQSRRLLAHVEGDAMTTKAVHARYVLADEGTLHQDRRDLRSLAKCDNIKGPIHDDAHLTDDLTAVTCGSCIRIIGRSIIDGARRAKTIAGVLGKKVRLLAASGRAHGWISRYGDVVTLIDVNDHVYRTGDVHGGEFYVRGRFGKHGHFTNDEAAWVVEAQAP